MATPLPDPAPDPAPDASPTGPLWAVVPAGGAGTRLWPLSRASSPKFLHDLTGAGRTLLQATIDRLHPLVGERVVVVTGAAHQDAVRRQLADLLPTGGPARVLAEPAPRDSMAAIGLAAAVLEREDPQAVIGSFAADHVIADPEAFRGCVSEAAAVARTGLLVTIGIEPTHAATGFGYIRAGDALPGFGTARAVREFVEKPDLERARGYLASGEYRWNAGMFVVGATVLLELLAREHPDLTRDLRSIAAEPERMDGLWPGLTKIAIDHAVAEPAAAAGAVAVVPGSFGWDDIGDYASLAQQLARQPAGELGDHLAAQLTQEGISADLRVLGDAGAVLAHRSTGLVVPAGGRTVAVVGLEDVVVVDTGDAVLVTSYAEAQDVKAVVDALKRTGRTHLT